MLVCANTLVGIIQNQTHPLDSEGLRRVTVEKSLSTNSPRNLLKTRTGYPMGVCGSHNHPKRGGRGLGPYRKCAGAVQPRKPRVCPAGAFANRGTWRKPLAFAATIGLAQGILVGLRELGADG